MQGFLEILGSAFQNDRNFLASRHANEKAASCAGYPDQLVRMHLDELLRQFRVRDLRRQTWASKNINEVDIWFVGTPLRKFKIIGYITDSRPAGPATMAGLIPSP